MNRIPIGTESAGQGVDLTGQLLLLGTGTSVGVPVVGCGCETCTSADPKNNRTRSSIVLGLPGGNLLVDTTPDLRSQLLREQVGRIHATVYTHDHADHLFGLDDLRIFSFYLGHPMPVWCEERVEQRIRKAFDYAFPRAAKIRRRSSADGISAARARPVHRAGPADHGARGCFTAAWKCSASASATWPTDRHQLIPSHSWSQLAGLDVLVLDALRPQPHPTHFSLDEAIAVARQLGARQTYFTHISHELEHEATNAALPPGMALAYDGLRVPLT